MKMFSRLWRATRLAVVFALTGLVMSSPARADIGVEAGTTLGTGGGEIDLACSDLSVAGTVNVEAGSFVNVRNINILPGGSITGDTGTIAVAGNWTNNGSFVSGTGTVRFVDDVSCAGGATLAGNTNFHNVSFVSTVGKIYSFTAGSTQGVSGLLTITGSPSPGAAISFRSTTPGSYAFIALSSTQNILDVTVDWVQTTGAHHAPNAINRDPNGHSPGWFRFFVAPPAVDIPTLNVATLSVLMLLLLGLGFGLMRRQVASNR